MYSSTTVNLKMGDKIMDKSMLNQFRHTVREKNLGIYGIHIYKEGKGTIEHRYRADDRVCLYSGSKTFTSIAIGICVDRGIIKLEDSVCSYFPEYESSFSEGSQEIRIVDLLHMSSGKVCDEGVVFQRRSEGDDWAERFFSVPLSHKPGSFYSYSNGCTYMLGRIVTKVTNQSLRDFLVPNLFTPLEIYNPQWHTCPLGYSFAASELYLTTSEFAKLGRLMLQGGEYNGKQLVSKDYVDRMSNDIVSTKSYNSPDWEEGYGYQIWRGKVASSYRADGMYGQFSIVFPDKGAVVTITSHEERSTQDILTAVNEDIYIYL